MASLQAGSEYPINRFLGYYLYGRDAVACSFLADNYKQILNKIRTIENTDSAEIATFWLIVGLIESGNVKEARSLLANFHPADKRILFSIFLGAIFLQHVRIASPEEKECADAIAKDLSNEVSVLHNQMLKEVKSALVEIREGNIHLLQQ